MINIVEKKFNLSQEKVQISIIFQNKNGLAGLKGANIKFILFYFLILRHQYKCLHSKEIAFTGFSPSPPVLNHQAGFLANKRSECCLLCLLTDYEHFISTFRATLFVIS